MTQALERRFFATADGSQWSRVAQGESDAVVFRHSSGERFAKVVAADRVSDLASERDRIGWLEGTGIGGPTVLDWAADEDGAVLTTSAVPGLPADELGAAELYEAWPSIIETLRRLHELPVESCPHSRTLDEMMPLAREAVALDRVHAEFLPEHLQATAPALILAGLEAELPQRWAEEQAGLVVCHGDFCLPNILVDPESFEVSGLIDLGRLGCADPYADVALLLANARESWEDETTALQADGDFATRYGIQLDPARQDFYLRLDPLTW